MPGLNRWQGIGNLGGDPEMRFTQNGSAVANLSVAINRKWTDANGQQHEEVEWVRIVAWNKLAELVGQYLAKGRQIYAEGRLQTRKYTDRDGVERWATEVVANKILFLSGGTGERSEYGGQAPASGASSGNGGIDADDLPFE